MSHPLNSIYDFTISITPLYRFHPSFRIDAPFKIIQLSQLYTVARIKCHVPINYCFFLHRTIIILPQNHDIFLTLPPPSFFLLSHLHPVSHLTQWHHFVTENLALGTESFTTPINLLLYENKAASLPPCT